LSAPTKRAFFNTGTLSRGAAPFGIKTPEGGPPKMEEIKSQTVDFKSEPHWGVNSEFPAGKKRTNLNTLERIINPT